jgi:outer membrane lipoprotein
MNPVILLVLIFLAGCQSRVPFEIRESPPGSPSVAMVQQDIKSYLGKRVRWGGVIVSVENRPNDTWLEIVSKELDDKGRPVESDVSLGRFFARTEGFLDPAVYKTERAVTVYGTVEELASRTIGERPYAYPVVKADKLYLWPEYQEYPYRYYPGWWDYPYYYPHFYPHYYPYYLRHPHFLYW